jgi:hypothetical protein
LIRLPGFWTKDCRAPANASLLDGLANHRQASRKFLSKSLAESRNGGTSEILIAA